MSITYKEYKSETIEIEDLDKWWIENIEKDYEKTDKYWLECLENNKPYCYGRNEIYRNLFYAENSKFKMEHSWVPSDIWKKPNVAFSKLLKIKGLW